MNPTRQIQNSAFTLVELLTVIAIIAILMGLLFPVVSIVKDMMRKAQAKNDVMQIVSATKQFQTDYGKYPSVEETPGTGAADILVGDASAGATINNSALFNTLRSLAEGLNTNHKLNPKRVVFFEGRLATDTQNPRAGFADRSDSASRGCFFDPWGKQYNVVIDANYDNAVTVTEQYSDFAGDHAPRVGVGAFSLGKDNQLGHEGDKRYQTGNTVSDDVVSWQ
ncbi:MAG: ral secretion pathway protein [Chthoniobacter sp.]|jgi:prepilin-type N-terminal cleavage/methylation domain-containing protein|nr:ral secretion pathway protein [Chthoniobacter sp.]